MSNAFADSRRRAKVHACVEYIDCTALEGTQPINPHDPVFAARIVEQLLAAPTAQWDYLESKARAKAKMNFGPLSAESRTMLLNVYRKRAGMPLANVLGASGANQPATPRTGEAGRAGASIPLGLCRGCGKPRDDATDQWCRACQAAEVASVMVETPRLGHAGERGLSQQEAFIDGPGERGCR